MTLKVRLKPLDRAVGRVGQQSAQDEFLGPDDRRQFGGVGSGWHLKFSVLGCTSTVKLPIGDRKVVGGDGAVPAAELRPDKADLIAAIALQGAQPEGAAA